MKIFIYGFGLFGKQTKNISANIVTALPSMPDVFTHIYQVRFDKHAILSPVNKTKPDIIIGLGQGNGVYPRTKLIRFETRAQNSYYWRKRMYDIEPLGPKYRASTIPIPNQTVFPVRLSMHAGTYVCNFSMYVLLGWCGKHNVKYGFFHIPKNYPIKEGVECINNMLKEIRLRGTNH